jgi:cobalamin 5'-phosphate synthase/cobalamin synthase
MSKPTFVQSLGLAVSFLTVLPIPPAWIPSGDEGLGFDWGRTFVWYPPIGLILGGLLAGAAWVLRTTSLEPAVQAGLLLAMWVLLTGALHLDGFIDTCDGLLAPVPVQRRLIILKDVHPGAFGVVGVTLLLGLKWALLDQLSSSNRLWPALLLAPMWGRWMLVWAAQRYPYARKGTSSLGATMRQGLNRRRLALATLFAMLALAVFVLAGVAVPAMMGSLLGPVVGLACARWAASRLDGGLTGDVYGALCELVELFSLLGIGLA